jgi:hypothetical protein
MMKVALASVAALLLVSAAAGCNRQPEPLPQPEKTADKPAPAAGDSAGMPAMPPGHPPVGSMAAPPGHGQAAATGTGAAAGPEDIAYDAPAAWTSAPNPSTMRKATFKIPKAGGEPEDAELAVSSAAGGVEANIKRWEGQFGPDAKAKTEPRTVNGLKVTVVEIKGKIGGGGMMGMPGTAAKENQMLLGAVVDAGDRQHFFKMVGGEKTVTAAKKDFDKLVSSFRAK